VITTRRSYTNYETFVVANEIHRNADVSDYWFDQARRAVRVDDASAVKALAAQIRAQHEEGYPELVGVLADLLGVALQSVNWLEIAATFVAAARTND
jgi:hypothetical protein